MMTDDLKKEEQKYGLSREKETGNQVGIYQTE